MKGILMHSATKNDWFVEYDQEGRKIRIEVRPNRIEHLNSVGVHLKNMDEVDFQLERTDNFPYQWAVPYVETESVTKSIPQKKIIKKKQITLWLSGFDEDEVEVICDRYDASSSGYWYFYDRESNKNGETTYIGAYPIERTIIHKIEEIEIEQ